jgi:CRISPR-associated protein Cas2
MPERSFYVIVYDIVADKRRNKLAKYLESLGSRAQKSVFEIYLNPAELEKLNKRLIKMINAKEDAVRIYDLCSACRNKVHSLGIGQPASAPGLIIV